MLTLPIRFAGRFLPKGWPDLLRQILLFCGAYWLYRLVRGFTDGRAVDAFHHPNDVVHLEQRLGVFVEPAVNARAEGREGVDPAAGWMLRDSCFTNGTVTLAFISLRPQPSFYLLRHMLMGGRGAPPGGQPPF